MIFAQGNHCEQILAGTKTQTRRRVKKGDTYLRSSNGSECTSVGTVAGVGRYTVGGTYAVQPGRGKKSVGRIEITKIRHEKVSDISDSDLKAEGGYTRDEYLALWRKMYNVDPQTAMCWVLDFKVVKDEV